ncbi:MAG TPA: DUF2059 domain-containing protein [Xanthobacteraceae bacterium]|nr:DUF2059 domain-containing protein [Xanthobacteraceae bacterium]
MRLFVLLVAFTLGLLPAKAQEQPSPEALQAASELLTVISPDLLDQMSAAVFKQVWSNLEPQIKDKVDAATLEDLRGELGQAMAKFVREFIVEGMPRTWPTIYARHFSVQELRDLKALYQTPLGKKILREMPELNGEVAGMLLPRMAAVEKDIGVRIQSVLARHGYNH